MSPNMLSLQKGGRMDDKDDKVLYDAFFDIFSGCDDGCSPERKIVAEDLEDEV